MICVSGLGGEYPVVYSAVRLESIAHTIFFELSPERFLGEKGSVFQWGLKLKSMEDDSCRVFVRRYAEFLPSTLLSSLLAPQLPRQEPSSLTESRLLASCLVQILRQTPESADWQKAIWGQIEYTLRIPDTKVRGRALWQCLRLAITHTPKYQGLWLIHTTNAPEQHRLLQNVVQQLQYLYELDDISWKVVVVNHSSHEIVFPSSSHISKVVLSQAVFESSIAQDITLQLGKSNCPQKTNHPKPEGESIRVVLQAEIKS